MSKEKDKCIMCGKITEYSKSTHINYRVGYIEGAGQLCRECWDRFNKNKE